MTQLNNCNMSIVMLCPELFILIAECLRGECHYAECHYAECCYAECRGAGHRCDEKKVMNLVSKKLYSFVQILSFIYIYT